MKIVSMLSCAALLLNACASHRPVEVPVNLKPGTNETLSMIVPARGVQIYECRARKEPGKGHEWVFVAPEADLFGVAGTPAGRHGAGPHWQALDGSRIKGTVTARADAPEPGNIPWLLLTTKQDGPEGIFSNVTSIQRVNTLGGVAPSTPCTAEIAGNQARVEYRADYYFFTAGLPVARNVDSPGAFAGMRAHQV